MVKVADLTVRMDEAGPYPVTPRTEVVKQARRASDGNPPGFPEEPVRDTVTVVKTPPSMKGAREKGFTMSRKSEALCLVTVMMGFSGYHIVEFGSLYGQTVTKNEDGYIASIHGLDIGGTSYNVTFTYNTSFNDVFGAGEPPAGLTPSFYYEGAEMAGEAMSVALNTQMILNEGRHGVFLYIPYQPAASPNPAVKVSAYTIAYTIGTHTNSHMWSEVVLHNLPRDPQSTKSEAWATFEPATAAEDP